MNAISTVMYLQRKYTRVQYKDLEVSVDVNVRYNGPGIDRDIIIPTRQFGYDHMNSVGLRVDSVYLFVE